MPRYKNTATYPVQLYLDGKIIKPGEELDVLHFYNKSELEEVDVNPFITPIDLCEIVDLDTTNNTSKQYDVLGKYKIQIICLAGQIELHFNTDNNAAPLILVQGEYFELHNNRNYFRNITIKNNSTTTNAKFKITIFNNLIQEL